MFTLRALRSSKNEKRTGSQWREAKTGVMWCHRLKPVKFLLIVQHIVKGINLNIIQIYTVPGLPRGFRELWIKRRNKSSNLCFLRPLWRMLIKSHCSFILSEKHAKFKNRCWAKKDFMVSNRKKEKEVLWDVKFRWVLDNVFLTNAWKYIIWHIYIQMHLYPLLL